jgi:predicted phosphodiesterase
MRLAFLADIQSNLPALEQVRKDLRLTAPDAVYLGGDQVNRCPWPNEVMALVEAEGWPAIYGNHEVVLLKLASRTHADVYEERERFADLWWTLAKLKPEYLAQLEQLPGERRIALPGAPPLLLLHGVPHNPFVGFYPEMGREEMAAHVAGIEEPVVISAHTHKPLARVVGKHTVYNPGSVGMPYNGDPRAQYMLLDLVEGQWQATFRQVDYDRARVRETFDRLGLSTAYGPLGPLYWKSIDTGDPWLSDFHVWVRDQAPLVRADLSHAVDLYLEAHGPGKWAFSPH